MGVMDCIGAVREASGNKLSDQEALDLLSRVEQLQQRAKQDRRFASTDEALQNLLKEQAEADRIKAAVGRKQAAFNAIRRDMREADLARLRTVYDPTESLLVLMRAGNKRVEGVRASASTTQTAWLTKHVGEVMERIVAERPQLERMIRSSSNPATRAARKAFAERVGREMWERSDNGKPGVTGDKDAQWMAGVLSDALEGQRQDLNRMGSGIGKITDYGYIPTEHMQDRVVKVDRETWIEAIERHYDLERSLPEMTPDERLAYLDDLFGRIVTGSSGRGARREGKFTSPGNYSSRLSQGRTLHAKSYNDWLAYQKRFGYDTPISAVLASLRNGARNGGLIDFFGHNPEKMLDSLAQQEIERISKDRGMPAKDKAKLGRELRGINDWATTRVLFGKSDIYLGQRGAGILAPFRAIQYVTKGAGIILSQLTDPVVLVNNMRFRGKPFLQAYGRTFLEYLHGRGSGESRRIAFLMGEGFNGLIDHLVSPFMHNDAPIGLISRATELLFKWTGVSWMDDTGRAVGTRMMAADLGSVAAKRYEALDIRLRNVLDLQGITPEKWEAIRASAWDGETGYRYITADRIELLPDDVIEPLVSDRIEAAIEGKKEEAAAAIRQKLIDQARFDLEVDLRRFFADELSFGMLNNPSVRTRAVTTAGRERGTWVGEIVRMFMSFKAFTVGFTQNVLGRQFFSAPQYATQAETILRQSLSIGELMATLTLAGLASMWAKDLVKGRSPRGLFDDDGNLRFETLMAAFAQSGGLGIYGDFLFGRENRFGNDMISTVAGPAFGDLINLGSAIATSRDVAYGRAKPDEAARKWFSLAQGNLPFINSPYTKAAADFLFLNAIRESLSPGYLRRQNQRLKEQFGQTQFVGDAWGHH
jgi:hypothetical protein